MCRLVCLFATDCFRCVLLRDAPTQSSPMTRATWSFTTSRLVLCPFLTCSHLRDSCIHSCDGEKLLLLQVLHIVTNAFWWAGLQTRGLHHDVTLNSRWRSWHQIYFLFFSASIYPAAAGAVCAERLHPTGAESGGHWLETLLFATSGFGGELFMQPAGAHRSLTVRLLTVDIMFVWFGCKLDLKLYYFLCFVVILLISKRK